MSAFSFRLFALELLFSEDFNGLPDWETTEKDYQVDGNFLDGLPHVDGKASPFDYLRSSEAWHPSEFTGAKPNMQISGNDPEKVYMGMGKSLIHWNESYQQGNANSFASDSFLTKDFIAGLEEVYVQFKIKFQPDFDKPLDITFLNKVFRVLHYDFDSDDPDLRRTQFFSIGYSSPIYIYEWGRNKTFGVRHNHAFRCDPQETNYRCGDPEITGSPRAISDGAMSVNYSSDLQGLDNPPLIPDLQNNGGYLPSNGTVNHDQVFSDKWHTLGFYLKLNSAAGVNDGVLKHWFDGHLIIDMNEIPWIGNGGDMNAKWNSISFGGNDYFYFDLDGEISERERWYAIDDIYIYDKVPFSPNSPSFLSVE